MSRLSRPLIYLLLLIGLFISINTGYSAPRISGSGLDETTKMVVLFSENFDAVAPNTIPPGWVLTGLGWQVSDAASSSGSGLNNLLHNGEEYGTIATPSVNLSGLGSAVLRYLARRSEGYPRDSLQVTASIDGGITFSIVVIPFGSALPLETSSYKPIEVSLPKQLMGKSSVFFRFEGRGGSTSTSTMRIDDFEVFAAPMQTSDSYLSFFTGPGTTQNLLLSLTNIGIDPLNVTTTITGEAFSISPTTEVSLSTGSTQSYTVSFHPLTNGIFKGSVQFAETGGTSVQVEVSGMTSSLNQFGFAATADTAFEGSTQIEIPLLLAFSRSDGLQGLQFTVSWSSSILELTGIGRGPAVASMGDWSVAYQAHATSVDVVLLGFDPSGLPRGAYDPLLVLQFRSGSILPLDELGVGFTMTGLIGALATPEGEDAGLEMIEPASSLLLLQRPGELRSNSETVNLGNVQAGMVKEDTLIVVNYEGQRDLTISSVTSTNSQIVITPSSGIISPGQEFQFFVSYAPTFEVYGRQNGIFVFTHNGLNGPTTSIPVAVVGVGGRGDAEPDGVVDILDLVIVIDFVLNRITPDAYQRKSSDQYPFPGGDSKLDVRDLTVMAQAIARGHWPNYQSIPQETLSMAESSIKSVPALKARMVATQHVEVYATVRDDGLLLNLRNDVPIRALQLVLFAGRVSCPPTFLIDETDQGTTSLAGVLPDSGIVRMITFRIDGGAIQPGEHPLAFLPDADGVISRYATAVDEQRMRLPVDVYAPLPTGIEREDLPQTLPSLGPLYPNPVSLSGGERLQIPFRLPHSVRLWLEIVDVSGRRVALFNAGEYDAGCNLVEWDGRDATGKPVTPGIYLIRIVSGKIHASDSVIILR